jgi:hypothetical protein
MHSVILLQAVNGTAKIEMVDFTHLKTFTTWKAKYTTCLLQNTGISVVAESVNTVYSLNCFEKYFYAV